MLIDAAPRHRQLIGRHTVQLGHSLSASEAFSDDTIARWIERSPLGSISLGAIDPRSPRSRTLRQGVIDGISGLDAIEAIRRGQFVLRLNDLPSREPDMAKLLDAICSSLEPLAPGYASGHPRLSLVVSSPRLQRAVEASAAARTLWQVRGQTRITIYPASPPFLSRDVFEACVSGDQTPLQQHVEPWFDEYASVVDLAAGRMIHWPLAAPVRMMSSDGLNVAIMTDHWPKAARDSRAVALVDAWLRKRLGRSASSAPVSGPGLWLRRPLAAIVGGSGWGRSPTRNVRIDFKLDPDAPGGLRPIEPFDFRLTADA